MADNKVRLHKAMAEALAAGAAMTRLGPESLFLVTAASHVSMAGFAIFRSYRRAPIPEGVRDAFNTVPAPPTATPGTAATPAGTWAIT